MQLSDTQFYFCEHLRETLSPNRTEAATDALMLQLFLVCNQSKEIATTLHPVEFNVKVFVYSLQALPTLTCTRLGGVHM